MSKEQEADKQHHQEYLWALLIGGMLANSTIRESLVRKLDPTMTCRSPALTAVWTSLTAANGTVAVAKLHEALSGMGINATSGSLFTAIARHLHQLTVTTTCRRSVGKAEMAFRAADPQDLITILEAEASKIRALLETQPPEVATKPQN